MKAINFLEWLITTIDATNFNYYNVGSNEYIYPCSVLENAVTFYHQPFTPEIITEYFEGWECVSSGEDGYEYTDNNYVIEITGSECINAGFIDNGQIIALMPELNIPKTLDSFKILLYEQAGIELTWKPEIIAKYFT